MKRIIDYIWSISYDLQLYYRHHLRTDYEYLYIWMCIKDLWTHTWSSMTSNLEFCGSVWYKILAISSILRKESHNRSSSEFLFWIGLLARLKPIIFSVGRASMTIDCETRDARSKRYYETHLWPRFSRDLEEISWEFNRASIFSAIRDNGVLSIGFHRFRHPFLSPPSTLFRARKPPPAGAAMCRDVFTLKATSDIRSSMRRWKWVIRSLTEIFRQDFALVS